MAPVVTYFLVTNTTIGDVHRFQMNENTFINKYVYNFSRLKSCPVTGCVKFVTWLF
jgi:hypothetical protein